MTIISQGFVGGNRIISCGYTSATSNDSTLFDDIVAWIEQTPAETFVRVGWGQPGFTTECRLLKEIVEDEEKV